MTSQEINSQSQTPRCKDVIKGELEDRTRDLKELWNAEEQETENLGELNNYGLGIWFNQAGDHEQREPYYQYQLSTGGPGDEFRIYLNGDVEYIYLNWFDGETIQVEDQELKEILYNFCIWTKEYENNKIRTSKGTYEEGGYYNND